MARTKRTPQQRSVADLAAAPIYRPARQRAKAAISRYEKQKAAWLREHPGGEYAPPAPKALGPARKSGAGSKLICKLNKIEMLT